MNDDQMQKINHANKFRIKIPYQLEMLETLRTCIEESAYSAEPVCALITAPAGAGKSTVMDLFSRDYPRVKLEDRVTAPVVTATIPVVPSAKSAGSRILSALGDPRWMKGNHVEQTMRIVRYLRELGTRLVILDEAQHLFSPNSIKLLRDNTDFLKTLINESKVPFALLGVGESGSEDKFLENRQVGRRFRQIKIRPLSYADVESKKKFRLLLRAIDRNLPFENPYGLEEPETASWIFKVTNGHLDLVMMLTREAAKAAILANAPKIRKVDLSAGEEIARQYAR